MPRSKIALDTQASTYRSRNSCKYARHTRCPDSNPISSQTCTSYSSCRQVNGIEDLVRSSLHVVHLCTLVLSVPRLTDASSLSFESKLKLSVPSGFEIFQATKVLLRPPPEPALKRRVPFY
jgi:hypothetical protein